MIQTPYSLKTNHSPLFLIITVCLNAGESFCQTFNSVMRQDFIDIEVMAKDRFSSDGSFEENI